MSSTPFVAPTLDALAGLLPAYEFESFIAQGGMGAVYKARQRSLDRTVAIKILPRELTGDPEFKDSFETEARAMARLNHPNLVGVYDSGEVDGMLYIVMEFVNGKPLYYSAYNTAIDPHQAAEIVKGICDGLAHAHEYGVIHRDIKPANILLTPKCEPKIGDFGLARPMEAEGPGLIMGTPGYAAPELTDNPEQADRRSDIFAVGVILYELLTGQRPEGEAPPPSAAAGCDRDLDVICHLATHPDPNQRYSDASLMSRALAEWLKKPVPAGPRKLVAANRPPATFKRPAPRTTGPIKVKGVRKPASPHPVVGQGTAAPVEIGGGGNRTLVRNLVIIAVLLIAIAITWKNLQRSKAARQEADRIAIAEKAQKDAKQTLAGPSDPENGDPKREPVVAAGNSKPVPVVPDPEPETPAESLARLKANLAAGKRGEMPVGTTRRGSTDSLLIPSPMTWQAASDFARAHGGHLALVNADDDLSWVSSLVPKEPAEGNSELAVWVGAGRSGRDSWTLVDGSPWKIEKTPVGAGQFVAVDDLGIVRVRKADDRYPFIIQWQRDGTNPASLEAVLARTRESLSQATPTFPPGTVAYEARHVLVVLNQATADEAEALAAAGGGHLAVPAMRDEAGWLADLIEPVDAADGLWIGGVLEGDVWKWNTGETWSFAQWDEGYPTSDGTALLAVPGKGWRAADPSQTASGFIIEWSNDRESASAAPPAPRKASPAAVLLAKSRELISGLEQKRGEDLTANSKTMVSNLETWVRRQKGSDITRWTPEVESIKQLIEDGRVPENIGRESGIRLSTDMAAFCKDATEKQKAIDAAFASAATTIRDAYVVRLTKARDDASERGQAEIAKNLDEHIEAAADLEGWVDSIRDGTSASIDVSSKKNDKPIHDEPIVGRWAWYTGRIIEFKEGGVGQRANKEGTIAWMKDPAEPTQYLVVWGGSWTDKLTISADGEKLSGRNSAGDSISAEKISEDGRELAKTAAVGTWKWFSDASVVIKPNGEAIDETRNGLGTWKVIDGGSVVISWDGGDWVDTVLVSRDLKRLTGTNQGGDRITAVRVSD